MQVEIITIGDEILIGQIVDTNSAWIARQLNSIGARVRKITSISDSQDEIITAMTEAGRTADVVLLTGGLGPTKDDLTKQALAKFFGCGHRFYPDIAAHIAELLSRFGKELSELNRLQAELPDACEPLMNSLGTAPGMWFEKNGKVFISMPGVPYEMKSIMEQEVIPRLKARFDPPSILHRTILTIGMGESWLSEKIAQWEDALPDDIKLAYLPSPGRVRLRLSGIGGDQTALSARMKIEEEKLLKLVPDIIYGYDEETMEGIVGNLLLTRKFTVSTAESCTGGMIAHKITSVPGSSAYFVGAVVSYSNRVKTDELGVSEADIERDGAVSETVVRQMAMGVKARLRTDFAVATSGIAGPDGGTETKPVGTVWAAVAGPDRTVTARFLLGNNRKRNIDLAALLALNMLRKELSACAD